MATEKQISEPLVLSDDADNNATEIWNEFEKPTVTQDTVLGSGAGNGEIRGDYVGHRAALLTTLSGLCLVFQICSAPGALLQKWSEIEIVGTYFTNGKESSEWSFAMPSKRGATLFQIISNYAKANLYSLMVLGIVSAFVIPFICISLNIYLVWAVHKLSVINACILSKQEWRLTNKGRFGKYLESFVTHKKVDAVLTFVEYVSKLALFAVYLTVYGTACLSAFPIVLNGDFNPRINETIHDHKIHHHNATHQLEVETNIYITFGQFFYMFGAGFILFTVILARFHWYSNRPLQQENGYSLIPVDDKELHASAFGKSLSNSQQGVEGNSEERSRNAENLTWVDDARDTEDFALSSKKVTRKRSSWELSASISLDPSEPNTRYDFWMKGFMFETGLLSLLLVAPVVMLPVTRFHYKGLYQPLVNRKQFLSRLGLYDTSVLYEYLKKDNILTLSLWDIAIEYAKNSGISNLSKVVITFFWIQVCIFPFVTLLLGIIVNIMGFFWKKMSRKKVKIFGTCVKFLRASYTASNVTIFAATILAGTKLLPYLFEATYNEDKFCDYVRTHIPGGSKKKCLEVTVEIFSGTWYLLAWGLSLDVFTSLTLQYYQTKII